MMEVIFNVRSIFQHDDGAWASNATARGPIIGLQIEDSAELNCSSIQDLTDGEGEIFVRTPAASIGTLEPPGEGT